MKLLRKAQWLIIPALLCTTLFVLMKTVLFLGYVPSSSMEPTIPAESWILGYRLYEELKTGDIVIFERNNKTLVKRIAAMRGDTVYLNDVTGEVCVNKPVGSATRILRVPEDSCFLLGDNSKDSIDARYWNEPFINCSQILAVIIFK